MEEMNTLEAFYNALKDLYSPKNISDPQNYRYVIYARKSTESEEKQVRSLGDQVKECKDFAERNNLRVVAIIEESESAKEPDIRPKFREMLTLLKVGKYDGVLAWHPDRLARNMKDAGEVIDLLDKNIIRDLKFASFTFENSTSGKMLLGIAFVLSKQYSDQLSDNVSRGNKLSVLEGRYINKPKHGYYKDRDQRLRPDGDNFTYIKQAFQMRLEGKPLDEIAEYLTNKGYHRSGVQGKKYYKMDKQRVSKFLSDTIYTGILIYGKDTVVNLTETYDFVPMVSVEDFQKINKLSDMSKVFILSRSYRKGEDIKANLMRQMVICAECGEFLSTGITPKRNRKGEIVNRYFYYRCETDDCPRKGKSTRAKVIMDFIYTFLDSKPFSNPEAYSHYKEEMERIASIRQKETRLAVSRLQGIQKDLEDKFRKTKALLLDKDNAESKKYFQGDLKKLDEQIKKNSADLAKARKVFYKNKVSILTYSEFLELWENMALNIRKMHKMEDLDFIIKKIFSNFTIKENKVEKYTLNSPFDRLETLNVSLCGR